MTFILSIDQGTTGTTAALINATSLKFIGKSNTEYPQIYPKPGWVEHNLDDIWASTEQTVLGVLEKFNIQASEISCIGITNQRETTCAFTRDSKPLANAIVWQDRRTHDYCQSLRSKEDWFKKKTGLPIDPYFSATKIKWLIDNNQNVKEALANDDFLFGNIDTFLLHKLTSGKSHFTEASNASRTLLMNLESCEWDEELLNIFSIPKNCLPKIKNSFDQFGKTSGLSFLPDGIPITGILGDQQAALFGQAGYNKGSMKCTYGTGAFMLLNTGSELTRSKAGLLTTIAYKDNDKPIYALEGSSYIAGAAVQWLRDSLKIIKSSKDIEALASSVESLDQMENILFLPFFTGIGSPHWISDAKAAIVGLTRDTENAHIARACLEGICLSINDLLTAMKEDSSLEINELRVDGGAVVNNLLVNIQATISDLKIIRPEIIETTAYGAALAAAIGAGIIKMDQIDSLWKEDANFSPITDEIEYFNSKKSQWNDYIQRNWL